MDVSLNFKCADKGRKIACLAEFNFYSESEKIMVLGITCDFEIQEDWSSFCKDDKIVVPKIYLNSSQCILLERREVCCFVKRKTHSLTMLSFLQ